MVNFPGLIQLRKVHGPGGGGWDAGSSWVLIWGDQVVFYHSFFFYIFILFYLLKLHNYMFCVETPELTHVSFS